MTYRIREVDPEDDDIADHIRELHLLTFADSAKIPDGIDSMAWWFAYLDKTPVAFAGLQRSTHEINAGYFNRVGVLHAHRGQNLGKRLMRALEAYAFREGYDKIISDCSPDNFPSANNFIASGYFMFQPKWPWSFDNQLYWVKVL